MKKVLSIALALIMVLSAMVMLVPTASAVEPRPDVSATSVGGKVYYEQNFDDPALAGLVDKDLADAFGWSRPGATATIMIEDGALRIVSQYTAEGNYPATGTGWGNGYGTRLVRDHDIELNGIVLEYTIKQNRRPAGSDPIVVTTKDGTTKTIKADGQGTYQGGGFYYEGGDNAGTDNYFMRFNPDGNGHTNTFKGWDNPALQSAVYWKTTSWERVTQIPDRTEGKVLEYHNNVPATESDAARTAYYMDAEYAVKIIIEPLAHRGYVFVNNVLVESLADVNMANFTINNWNRAITKYIGLHVKPGQDVQYDNIKISEYVPALTISEVMTNGQFRKNGTTLASAATAVGKYQWMEITNTTDGDINVYDYGVHVWNMPTYRGLIGSEDLGTNDTKETGYYCGGAPTMGYFTPGAKTLGEEVFYSPAYEDGVLAAGESAIVLLPQTAMEGGLSVTDEAFKSYLVGLGMPEDTMLLVADNKSEYPFAFSHHAGEGMSISILKVENRGTDGAYDPYAPAIGQPGRFINAFAECTTILTSKTGGGTNYFGLKLAPDSVNDGFSSNIPTASLGDGSFSMAEDKSYEVSYTGWEAAHANLQWGFEKYSPKDVRKNAAGEDVYATPGFVPVDCRRAIDVTLVDNTGKTQEIAVAKLLTDSTVTFNAPAAKAGFAIDAYLDGALYAEDVAAETAVAFAIDGEKLTNASDIDVEFKYRALGANIIGIQKSEDNTIRILAGVGALDLANDSLGFAVMINYNDEEMVKELYCQYVYDSVTVDGAIKTAASFGYDYLFALHITDAPLDALNGDLVITAEAMLNGEGSPMGPVEFTFAAE